MAPTAGQAPPSLVVFDLGGVVVRICRSWDEACAAAGVPVRRDERLTHPDAVARRRALHRMHESGQIDGDAYFQGVSLATGGLYSADEVRAIHRSWILGEYQGIGALLRRLGAHDWVQTACLSNTNAAHWDILGPSIAPLHRCFASHAMKLAKPDERIYRAVERATERRPEEILFFDDMPENIDAAIACGWRAVRIDHAAETAPQIDAALRTHGVWEGPATER
jgi:putative hydrolase of the HAD superfamily